MPYIDLKSDLELLIRIFLKTHFIPEKELKSVMSIESHVNNIVLFFLSVAALVPIQFTPPKPSRNLGSRPNVQRLASTSIDSIDAQVQFINSQRGWIADGKKLWRTDDGGLTWDLLYTGEAAWGVSAYIGQIQFIDSETGWMLVIPTGLYKTEDGGRTWIVQALPNYASISSIRFFEHGKKGWIAGEILRPAPKKFMNKTPRPDSYAVISFTNNGGKTWKNQPIPFTRRILALYFLDDEHGWALGSPGLFYLEKDNNLWKKINFYNDGCANSILSKTLNPTNVVHGPTAIFFLDQYQGWLSFQNGYIAKTIDGGKTWCDLLNPRDVWPDPIGVTYFWKIYFIDPNRGWAVGYSSLYETKDGGASWKKVDLNAEFKNIYFLDSGHGWAVAKEGIYSIRP